MHTKYELDLDICKCYGRAVSEPFKYNVKLSTVPFKAGLCKSIYVFVSTMGPPWILGGDIRG